MISQQEMQGLIKKNRIELDKLNDELSKNPEWIYKTYPLSQDPEFTYSHQLTRLVAEKLLLKKINGSLHY